MDFSNPNSTGQHLTYAQLFCLTGGSAWATYYIGARYDVATAYDSFTFYPGAGTITGAIGIYGYRK